jgi:HSP20 family protein
MIVTSFELQLMDGTRVAVSKFKTPDNAAPPSPAPPSHAQAPRAIAPRRGALENLPGVFISRIGGCGAIEDAGRGLKSKGGVNAMNVKSLVPWGKSRNLEASRVPEGASPFLALHREMNRMFDDFLSDFGMSGRPGPAWPHIELSEADDELKVVAELPGLEERDVEVTLQDGVLTLKGQKKGEENGRLYSERWEGAFERTIPVGQDVDPDKVKASFRNGVLTVLMPKKPEAQRQVKRIAIN